MSIKHRSSILLGLGLFAMSLAGGFAQYRATQTREPAASLARAISADMARISHRFRSAD
ncbi:MAG: hypothetical protein KGL40_11390 [Rhodocyclaceae bacterium]|nr:hypothetical protein [Rhodocyclaceae bacterium]